MKKRIVVIAGVLLVVIVAIGVYMANPMLRYHNSQVSKAMEQLREKNGEEISLNEVIPFSWDAVYTFAPYTSKQNIEERIGFSSGAITETVNEGMTQLIFVKDKKAVASICGYSDKLGYSIEFSDCIEAKDEILFQVNVTDDKVQLKEKI